MSELEANVEAYSRLIWYVVRGNRLLEEDARDLFMEIWEAVIRGWPSFQGDCRPATWIAAVARRRCADFFRRRREVSLEGLRTGGDEEGPAFEPADPAAGRAPARRQARELIEAALTSLPPRQEKTLRLWMAGYSYREIAQELGREGFRSNAGQVGKLLLEGKRRVGAALRRRGISSVEDLWE